MKILGKTLKVLSVTVLTLLVLLILGIGVFLKWPEVLINEANLRRAARFAAYFDIAAHWDGAEIKVESPGLLNKRFLFDFENLCVFWADDRMRACFPRLSLGGQVAFYDGLQVLEAGPVIIKEGSLFFRLPEAQPETQPQEKKNPLALELPEIRLPKLLRVTQFKKIDVSFKEIELVQGDQSYQFQLNAKSDPDANGRLEKIDVGLNLVRVPGFTGGRVDLNVRSPAHFQYDDWNVELQTDLSRKGGQKIQASGRIDPQPEGAIQFQLNGKTVMEGVASDLGLNGTVAQGALRATIQANLVGGMGPIQTVRLDGCSLELNPASPRGNRGQLSFQCPGVVTVEKVMIPNPEVEKEIRIPTKLSFNIDLNARTPLRDFEGSSFSGLLKINFDAVSRKLLSAAGDIKIDFAGRPQEPIDRWKINTFLDFGFKLKEVANLVKVLKESPYAVWAPLHVLNGTAELKVKGKLNLKKKRGEVPIEFQTRFFSTRQKINTDGKGRLRFDFAEEKGGLDLKLALFLDQLQLALPTFHLGPLPNFLPDNRFKKPGQKEPPSKKEMPFKYLVTIKTLQDGALLSNLSKNGRVPFSLDLKLTSEGAGGKVTVKDTPVEFFKRVAEIKNFEIELDQPIDKSRLDGNIDVSYSAYDITIKVIGSIKRPRYIFESQPPLDREQIISVLIYGRTFDDLNQSEAGTVNAVSSAAAERALTLGSMYLLASTPIESVSYNPSDNQITARLRVAKGTSIDLGTKEGKTQNVGLRQRLGGNWFINTYVENDSETGAQSGGATLEWSKRY